MTLHPQVLREAGALTFLRELTSHCAEIVHDVGATQLLGIDKHLEAR